MRGETVAAFLQAYKNLVHSFESATTQQELVSILLSSSGMCVIPQVLFLGDGTLRSFKNLRATVHQHLELLVSRNTDQPTTALALLVNTNHSQKRSLLWSLPGVPRKTDNEWAQRTYGTELLTCSEIRAVLIRDSMYDLRLYVTAEGWPREDTAKVLAELRNLSHRT